MWTYVENYEKQIILELRLLFVKKYEQIWTCFLVSTLMQENQHSQSQQRVAALKNVPKSSLEIAMWC